MRIIVKEPKKEAYVKEIKGTVEEIQKIIGNGKKLKRIDNLTTWFPIGVFVTDDWSEKEINVIDPRDNGVYSGTVVVFQYVGERLVNMSDPFITIVLDTLKNLDYYNC